MEFDRLAASAGRLTELSLIRLARRHRCVRSRLGVAARVAPARSRRQAARASPRSPPTEPSNPFEHVAFGVGARRLLPVQLEPARTTASTCCAPTTRAPTSSASSRPRSSSRAPRRRRRPPLRRARRPAVRPGHGNGAGQRRQRAAAGRLSPHLAGLRHLRVPGRHAACRPTSASSRRSSATRPTTRRTTTTSRARTCSTSCRSITRACA